MNGQIITFLSINLNETPYASQEAVDFADKSMEMVSYYAIKASSNLAKERGAYQSYSIGEKVLSISFISSSVAQPKE